MRRWANIIITGITLRQSNIWSTSYEATDMPRTELNAYDHIYHLLARQLILIEQSKAEIDQRSPAHT